VAFSHPGRCRNDAAFASLSGTCPIPASSGHTVRHRLNRGGDRALNRAIHTIATVRMRDCPTTKAYIARRTAQGKTIREIKRCLKRYIARQLYRTLTATMTPTTNTPAIGSHTYKRPRIRAGRLRWPRSRHPHARRALRAETRSFPPRLHPTRGDPERQSGGGERRAPA